ncbi:MAG TPA: hypothetical protein VK457_24525 [Chloroflexota bacterium]|nr:hypothetical protein [Chloroflexota bacterium]
MPPRQTPPRRNQLVLDVRLDGLKEGESPPTLAVYLLGRGGSLERRVGQVTEGKLTLDAELGSQTDKILAVGPDVEDVGQVPRDALMQFRIGDQWPIWEKEKLVEIPRPWWQDWFIFRVCLSGQVRRCFPILLEERLALRNPEFRLPFPPFPPPLFCAPVCNGVVEVYERECCCRPWPLIDIAEIIRRIRQQLVAGPVIGPPGPGPVEQPLAVAGEELAVRPLLRTELRNIKKAEAFGTAQLASAEAARLAEDVHALETLPRAEAVKYVEERAYLWPFWCTCGSRKVGEAVLSSDGHFTFCYRHFPDLRRNCFTTYCYKVKQWQGNQWAYIYDGCAHHQFFSAGQFADITTTRGQACGDPGQWDNDRPFVALQDIGSTRSYALNSHYLGMDGAGHDLTQVSATAVAAPPANGGLCNPSSSPGLMQLVNQPWGEVLLFRLHFDPGMKALGARYYRISVVLADANGQPNGTPTILTNAVAWQKFVHVNNQVQIQVEGLGPNPVGAETGLYVIPYADDADWLDGQYHQYWDTRVLKLDGTPAFDGWCLVGVEVFDAAGNKLTPAANNFDFLRLFSEQGPGSTAKVEFAALQHLFWIDNRPVYADIEDLRMDGVASGAECQFMAGSPTSTFSAGYRAFHVTRNSNLPPETFLYYYTIWYHRGLNGPNVTIQTGGENEPSTLSGGSPAVSTPQTFASMLGPNSRCTFALNLWAYAKHTNGSRRLSEYDRSDQAAFALEVGP